MPTLGRIDLKDGGIEHGDGARGGQRRPEVGMMWWRCGGGDGDGTKASDGSD